MCASDILSFLATTGLLPLHHHLCSSSCVKPDVIMSMFSGTSIIPWLLHIRKSSSKRTFVIKRITRVVHSLTLTPSPWLTDWLSDWLPDHITSGPPTASTHTGTRECAVTQSQMQWIHSRHTRTVDIPSLSFTSFDSALLHIIHNPLVDHAYRGS